MQKHLFIWFKVVVSITLLAITFNLVGADNLWRLLCDAAWQPLALATLLLVIAGFTGMGAWHALLQSHSSSIPLISITAAHWSGMFFNSFLPTNIGGDIIRGTLITPHVPQRHFIVASLIADRLLGLYSLAMIGAIALTDKLYGTTAACIVAVCATLLVIITPLIAKTLLRTQPPSRFAPYRLARIFWSIVTITATPRPFLKAALYSLITQIIRVWQNLFIIKALALNIPEVDIWTIIPVFGIVSALPLSIGGLGLREYVAQAMAGSINLSSLHLITLSLVGHALVIATNSLGLIPFLVTRPPSQRGTQKSRTSSIADAS